MYIYGVISLLLDYHTRIDENVLSTVRHRRRLTNITSPSLKQQPSILKSRSRKRSRTAPIPYQGYQQENTGYPQQQQQEDIPAVIKSEPSSVAAPPTDVEIAVPVTNNQDASSSLAADTSYSAQAIKSLSNDSGLSETVLESPQLFKLNKSGNLPFSPSQVFCVTVCICGWV